MVRSSNEPRTIASDREAIEELLAPQGDLVVNGALFRESPRANGFGPDLAAQVGGMEFPEVFLERNLTVGLRFLRRKVASYHPFDRG